MPARRDPEVPRIMSVVPSQTDYPWPGPPIGSFVYFKFPARAQKGDVYVNPYADPPLYYLWIRDGDKCEQVTRDQLWWLTDTELDPRPMSTEPGSTTTSGPIHQPLA